VYTTHQFAIKDRFKVV